MKCGNCEYSAKQLVLQQKSRKNASARMPAGKNTDR